MGWGRLDIVTIRYEILAGVGVYECGEGCCVGRVTWVGEVIVIPWLVHLYV